jgi:hypothetical protein
MNRTTKLIGIVLCVGFLGSLAAPALAFSPSGNQSTRHPCIFVDNNPPDTFWQTWEKDLATRAVSTPSATVMQNRLDAANNLTAFLADKGYGVENLRSSLDHANTALQQNDAAAFREAVRTFFQSLRTDVQNGFIDETVLEEYYDSSHSGLTTTPHHGMKPATKVINSLTTIPRWIIHHVIPVR